MQQHDPTQQATHEPVAAFLRRRRELARLTQEELAERAGLSARSIRNLERGAQHLPRLETVRLLAQALDLSTEEQAEFIAAARRQEERFSAVTSPSADASPTAIPLPLTSLIGRTQELRQAEALLSAGDVRLLTIVGPPGVGKTRLALALAAEARRSYTDGVCFAPLAPLHESAQVPGALARALGAHEDGARAPLEILQNTVQQRRLLLVVDNFEHLTGAAPLLADLLALCPCLSILVTSRTPLHLPGERLFEVSPLALPGARASGTLGLEPLDLLEQLAGVPAVALFVARAQAARADFTLTSSNAAAISSICRRLDGVPLALELAAAWIRVLSPPELLARLERWQDVLTDGPRNLLPRHQTVQATIAWSHDLLTADEQTLYRRIAVFVGGCTLVAAEAVCRSAPREQEGRVDQQESALLCLARLIDSHLLQREASDHEDAGPAGGAGETRISLLQTIRDDALERLRTSGESPAIERAHAEYFFAFAADAEPQLRGPDQARWLARLDREHDNLRAALTWATRQRAVSLGLGLAAALWPFWNARGVLTEGRAWLERMIALADEQSTAGDQLAMVAQRDLEPALAKALNGAGVLASRQSDYTSALAFHERALALRRRLDDLTGVASSLNNLGGIAMEQANYRRAQALWEESLALRRALGESRAIALGLSNLGALAHYQGRNVRAVTLLEEALTRFRAVGDHAMVAMTLNNLGAASFETGEAQRGWDSVSQSLALARQIGLPRDTGRALNNLAHIAYQHGDLEQASTLGMQSLTQHQALGDKWYQADDMALLGAMALDRNDLALAQDWQEEALELRQTIGQREGVAHSLLQQGRLASARQDWRLAIDRSCEALAAYCAVESAVGVATCLEVVAGMLVEWSGERQVEHAIRLCELAARLRYGTQTVRAPYEAASYERVLRCAHALLGADGVAAMLAAPAQGAAGDVAEQIELAQAAARTMSSLVLSSLSV